MADTQQQNRNNCDLALSCWFLTGATASGKTTIGIQLAQRLNAEIISLDSMAVYRGMNVGTAKPTRDEQQIVPHHLLDIADPVDAYSVTQYRDAALAAIEDIRARGKEVLFVGGTALYLKALLSGIFEGPPADWEFRKSVEAEVESGGLPILHQRLAQVDPVSAHKLHPNDKRRIIRALEVYKLTGEPISHLQNEFEITTPADQCRVFSIRHPREQLHKRIDDRVGRMFDLGLVDEVRTLLEKWGELGHTASQAVGYKEVIDLIRRAGQPDAPTQTQTHEKVLVRTRKFARHQETWFRGLSECRIIDIDETWTPDNTVEKILALGEEVSAKNHS